MSRTFCVVGMLAGCFTLATISNCAAQFCQPGEPAFHYFTCPGATHIAGSGGQSRMVACGLSNPICEVDRAPPSSSLNNAPRSDPLPAPIHGKFGIKYRNVDRDTALKLGLSTMRGALVIGTVVGSPAARAGIIVGDVIVQINGVNVNEPSDFAKVASEVLIGDEIPIIVIRDRKQLRFLSGVALLDPNLTSNSQDNSPAQNQFEQWLKTP